MILKVDENSAKQNMTKNQGTAVLTLFVAFDLFTVSRLMELKIQLVIHFLTVAEQCHRS